MSLLTNAIGEIQKPSWWGSLPASSDGKEDKARDKRPAATNAIKRQELMKSIKAHGVEMTVSELMDETGWTRQTIGALASPLVKDGTLIRDSNCMKTAYRVSNGK